MSAPGGWRQVWERRALDPARGSALSALMAADGLDTAFGQITERRWREFVNRRAGELGAGPGTAVYEVGCGAGAFLYVLAQSGCEVAGLDQSATLVGLARQAIPAGRFDVAEATGLAVSPPVDIVVSCGVFLYFPGLDYAAKVIELMAAGATRAVAILDIPDAATREGALAARIELAGGEAAYRERYAGLEHLYYERSWIAGRLAAAGLVGVKTADQDIPGYANGPFRFNAWGFAPS